MSETLYGAMWRWPVLSLGYGLGAQVRSIVRAKRLKGFDQAQMWRASAPCGVRYGMRANIAKEMDMGTCRHFILLACSMLAAACATAEKSESFTGEWSYGKDCEGGGYITLELKQSGKAVTGEWSEGTNSRGDQGLIKGQITKDGTLVALYCSSTGQDSTLCPEYDATVEDHFRLKGDALLRSKKYGSEYRQDFTLLRSTVAAVETCQGKDQ